MKTTEATMICTCGFEAKSKSGFALHLKKCPKAPILNEIRCDSDARVRQEVQKAKLAAGDDSAASTALAQTKDPPLTTSDRNAFTRLIKARQEAMLKALTDESSNPDQVGESLRRQIGITLSPTQIETLIKSIDEQIDSTIEESVADEKERIEVALSDLDESYEEKQRQMKERHRKEWHDLAEEQKDERGKLKKQLRDAKEKVVIEKAGDLHQKRAEYKALLVKTRQLEARVQAESVSRITLLKTSRKRLEHIIQDATNRALEELWMTDSRAKAAELVKAIPTVSEALRKMDSMDGFNELMKRLDPQMALPPPTISPSEVANMKTIEAVVIKEEDVESSYDRRNRERRERDREQEHERVYEGVEVGVNREEEEEGNT